MSGWIKVEKDLSHCPQVLRMASRLRNAHVTLGSNSRLVIVGALVTLWWYADTHIRDDDTLPVGADQIDELVGLAGFCDLMPSEWLEVVDSDSVKLVNYLAHNGTSAKNRALTQQRVELYRRRNAPVTPLLRSGNDYTVTRPRPREDLDKTSKSTTAREAAPALPEWFIEFKQIYPDRAGDQGWHKALKAANARFAEKHTPAQMLAGARRYAAFISATGKAGTEYVQQAATFLGPGKPFLNEWSAPAQTESPMDEIRRLNGLDKTGEKRARTIENEDARTVGQSLGAVRRRQHQA